MSKTRALTCILICTIISLISCSLGHRSTSGQVPACFNHTVQSRDGKSVDFVDYTGEVTLLNFWASWCQQCLQEMPAFEKLHKRFEKEGLKVVSVAVDDNLDRIKIALHAQHLTYPIVLDLRNQLRDEFDVRGLPVTLFIDETGKIIPFLDPQQGKVVQRVEEYRDWDSAPYVQLIAQILGSN